LVEIAQEAQRVYGYYLFDGNGEQEFCERFCTLMSFEN